MNAITNTIRLSFEQVRDQGKSLYRKLYTSPSITVAVTASLFFIAEFAKDLKREGYKSNRLMSELLLPIVLSGFVIPVTYSLEKAFKANGVAFEQVFHQPIELGVNTIALLQTSLYLNKAASAL